MTQCVNAYMNLSVHPNGIVKPCCMSRKNFITDNKNQTLESAKIMEFWQGRDRQNFIQRLEQGELVSECSSCWIEEKAGKQSKRLRDNQRWGLDNFNSQSQPTVLDISMDNLCNLRCRICGPENSSQWVAEESKRLGDKMPKMFKVSSQWHELIDFSDSIQHIDFSGGEPFYIDGHWQLLKELVSKGRSRDISLHYNTNGTIFPTEHVDLLNQFKSVDIQISTDGIERKFEYMRHPAVWAEHINNIEQFKNQPWRLGVCFSLSVFNINDVFETYEFYKSLGLSFYLNIVHGQHSVQIIPRDLRNQLVRKIEACHSKQDQKDWEEQRSVIIGYLNSPFDLSWKWQSFWLSTYQRDQLRQQDYTEVFPDMWKMVEPWLASTRIRVYNINNVQVE